MTSLAQWTGVWANAGRQWRTGKPGLLLFLGVTKSWTRLHHWTTTINFFFLSPCLFNFILFLNFTIFYWFCQISKWICHRYTCIPHPEPSSLLPPCTIPVHQPQASSIVHRTWIGDSFHIWYYTYFNAILPYRPTLSLSHRVQNSYVSAASVQFSSVAQSYLTLCDPMNLSTPGLPVHHQLLEFTQTHVHMSFNVSQVLCLDLQNSCLQLHVLTSSIQAHSLKTENLTEETELIYIL